MSRGSCISKTPESLHRLANEARTMSRAMDQSDIVFDSPGWKVIYDTELGMNEWLNRN